MEQWIIDALKKLKVLYQLCEREVALKEYIICIMRMLNGLAQIQHTTFHEYERQILSHPIEIFTEEFMEQVSLALANNDKYEKKKYIIDIENSLYEVIGAYKNILDSMANSDRQIFMSKAVDTKMYELSPRLCAFYSGILEEIVDMFSGQAEKLYAFLLQPTMRSRIYTSPMFSMRNKSGKVIIVYIPENAMEEFDVLPINLLHEAFHVITKEERLRKKRAIYYLKNMVLALQQLLFEGVDFGKADDQIKEKLMEYWFGDIRKMSMQIQQKDDNSRELYSHELTSAVIKELEWQLIHILDKINEGVDSCYCGELSDSFNEYMNLRKSALDKANQISKNAIVMLNQNHIETISKLHMRIYREVYADLACLLTLGASSEIYQKTFQHAIRFYVNEDDSDYERNIRCMFVADAVSKSTSGTYVAEWQEYADSFRENVRLQAENARQFGGTCVSIKLTDQMIDYYQQYFRACAEELMKTLVAAGDIIHFREKMNKLMHMDQTKILQLILGAIDE